MILIALNAFFASSEIALISLNDNKIKLLARQGNKKAVLLYQLLKDPGKFLATLQIGITLAGFLASAFASESFADMLVQFMVNIGLPIPVTILKTISMIIITLILSYFTLVFGELVPKRLAMKKAQTISMFAAKPLQFLSIITLPFVKLLTFSTNFVVRLFGIDPNEEDKEVTEEEIRMMVDVGEERGVIHETEKKMINNIFEFDNKTVEDIMTHRTDIVGISVDTKFNDIISLTAKEKYTRIPVYESNIDNIIGILHTKDLISFADVNYDIKTFKLQDIIRRAYYVPSSKRTDELFRELQKSKNHMAIVIDEYGGTAGIVTIEDLLEEIVGNIFDEYDEEENYFQKLDETTYLINGSVSLDIVADYLNVRLPVEEYDTLSGFVIGQLGRIPKNEEKPEVEFNGIIYKVEKVDEKKISLLKVCKVNEI